MNSFYNISFSLIVRNVYNNILSCICIYPVRATVIHPIGYTCEELNRQYKNSLTLPVIIRMSVAVYVNRGT
jgi:hypothetical protein